VFSICEFVCNICILFSFFILSFLFLSLVVSPRLPMRILWDLGMGGVIYPFLCIFLGKIFTFCIIFLILGLFVPFLSVIAWLLVYI